MYGMNRDYEDIMKETELDSAKMVLRLTSELREKEIEVASTRSRSFDEIQRNNKAKEAEFEALMRAQEERIAKREQDLARLLVEKESGLWQKYQAMLEDAIGRQRAEFEGARELLKADIEKKEAELAAQKKNLRAEMETLFKKWEAERETDFKTERETFIEELKLGRGTAQKDSQERARQMEELWGQKLAQQEEDYKNREAITTEGIRSQMRRERVEELKVLNDRLNAEFTKREQELYAHYAAWLEENKKLLEEKASARIQSSETEYHERTARLADSLEKLRGDLAGREKTWADKYAELKKFYAEKEAGLDKEARALEAQHLSRERELAEKHEALARDLREEAARRKDALTRKEKDLEQQFANNLAEFAAETERRLKGIEARESKTAAERQELSALREQIGELLAQKQIELEKTFEERNSIFRQSLEESLKIKEISLAKKYEDMERQYSAITAKKDAAMARIDSLLEESANLKDALASRDSQAHGVVEAERARLDEERRRLEKEFEARETKFKEELQAREQAARSAYSVRLAEETERLQARLKVKEEALEKEREAMNKRAGEMETGFLTTLRAREAEVTENFRRSADALKAQAEAARRGWEAEKAALLEEAETRENSARDAERQKLAGREAELNNFYETREVELRRAADDGARAAERHLAENFSIKERDLTARVKAMEDNLAKAAGESEEAARALGVAKEDLELLTRRLDESERERQKLIQENLTKARDLRQTLEKEFLDKLKDIEQNYLGQLTDLSKRSDEARKADQDEYFRKLQFVKDDFTARLSDQSKDMETSYLERERNLTAALGEAFKLKEKALGARQAQLESSYQAMLAEKSAVIDTDRSLAENVERLKEELEHKNKQLKGAIDTHSSRQEELETKLRADFETRKKELEDAQRMRAAQLEAERGKLKAMLDQEQELVTGLQKREIALQETYAEREADMARRFKEARERLEKDYQDRMKDLG